MTEIAHAKLLELTSGIISAHVANSHVPTGELAGTIETVYQRLAALGEPPTPPEVELKPAVPIKKSITDDYLICLEDGRELRMLKRHLMAAYNMTPEDYRAKWKLPHDYPMVAPNYAKKRQQLAKKSGLGRKPAAKGRAKRK